jgi:hypothetical protein
MSMWLNLAKVSPELLTEIRAEPDLLDSIFFDEDDLPDGLSLQSDVFGCDYRTLSAIAEFTAEQVQPGVDWRERYIWLRRATGDNEADHLVGYEFTYGPAFTLAPTDVQRVAEGLASEEWSYEDDDEDLEELDPLDATDIDEDDDDDFDEGDDEDDDQEYEDFVDLVPFFAAAAREGKAIVGGVS